MISYSELWAIQEPILAMAVVVETYLHFSGRIREWKTLTAKWWYELQVIPWPRNNDLSKRFYDLFIAIYGIRLLSFRRVIASALSSLFFIVILFWFLNRIGQTFFNWSGTIYALHVPPWLTWLVLPGSTIPSLSIPKVAMTLHDSLGFNLIPDIISIAETGWILRKASESGSKLSKLAIIDFAFTTLIWIVAHSIAYAYTTGIEMGSFAAVPLSVVYSDATWLAAIGTTYSTSLLWIGFLFTLYIMIFLRRASSTLVSLLESKLVQELPFALMIGIPCLVAWPTLFIARLIYS